MAVALCDMLGCIRRMRATRCLASASKRLLHAGAAAEAAGAAVAPKATSHERRNGRLPNREHIFQALDRARNTVRTRRGGERQLDGDATSKRGVPAPFRGIAEAASSGDVQAAVAALRELPDKLACHGAVYATRVLLASPAGREGAENFVRDALDGVLTPETAGGAAAVLLRHRYDSVDGPTAADELISYSLELRQSSELPPSSVAHVIRTAGELGDGMLLRELWSALARPEPTLGECNAFLRAALMCGDAEATELALRAIAETHGAVNGDTLVSLFSAASTREEARDSAFQEGRDIPVRSYSRTASAILTS